MYGNIMAAESMLLCNTNLLDKYSDSCINLDPAINIVKCYDCNQHFVINMPSAAVMRLCRSETADVLEGLHGDLGLSRSRTK